MISQLKKTFDDFYRQFKCILWTAMILVTLPLTFRAIFDFIRMDSHVIQWLNANMVNGAVYNLSVFVLTTYLPILF
jgi:hypothetical protein